MRPASRHPEPSRPHSIPSYPLRRCIGLAFLGAALAACSSGSEAEKTAQQPPAAGASEEASATEAVAASGSGFTPSPDFAERFETIKDAASAEQLYRCLYDLPLLLFRNINSDLCSRNVCREVAHSFSQ